MNDRAFVFLAACLAIAGTQCKGSGTATSSHSTGSGGSTASSAASTSTTSSTGSGKMQAPTELRAFEGDAEAVGEACVTPDYTKAQGVLAQTNANWATIKPQVQAAGAPAALVSKIDSELAMLASDISGSQQKACETDANVVTLAVPDLFDLYTWPVPSDALRGDGVFRQLQIDGEYKDWTRTAADLALTKSVWANLRPLAMKQAPLRPDIVGSGTVINDMDTAIQKADSAITAMDATALLPAAQSGLDAIDVVEGIFK